MIERSRWRADLLAGVAVYAITALPVLAGLAAASAPGAPARPGAGTGTLERCCHYDGAHYGNVATDGYRFRPGAQSSVAFFPGYPLAVRALMRATGWPVALALV